MRLRYLPIAALGSLLCLPAAPLAAQQLPGYSPAASARERALEADAISRPDTADARKHSLALGSTVHVAGTPAQARTRDYVIGQMKSWGLPTRVRTYSVFLPHATSVHVWRVRPDPEELSLREPAVTGDSFSGGDQYPTVNGSSAAGDVTAPVVYVNYGLIEDYAKLDSLGVSVKGKIAVARYGRSFRGIKAREAEKHGAAALLIYSDPEDDGYDPRRRLPRGTDAALRSASSAGAWRTWTATRPRPAIPAHPARSAWTPTRSSRTSPSCPSPTATPRSCWRACAAPTSRRRGRAASRSATTSARARS